MRLVRSGIGEREVDATSAHSINNSLVPWLGVVGSDLCCDG